MKSNVGPVKKKVVKNTTNKKLKEETRGTLAVCNIWHALKELEKRVEVIENRLDNNNFPASKYGSYRQG